LGFGRERGKSVEDYGCGFGEVLVGVGEGGWEMDCLPCFGDVHCVLEVVCGL
jgi:hypothetical protein